MNRHNQVNHVLTRVLLFVCLVFNGTFSTARLYRAIGEWSVLRQLRRDDHDDDEQPKQ